MGWCDGHSFLSCYCGGAMPAPTQFVIDISHWMLSNGIFVVIGIIILIVAFTAFLRWPRGREMWDAFTDDHVGLSYVGLELCNVRGRKGCVALH